MRRTVVSSSHNSEEYYPLAAISSLSTPSQFPPVFISTALVSPSNIRIKIRLHRK